MNGAGQIPFSYDEAFQRNVGWVTEWEQQVLAGKKVAIAGMGGVGGLHLLTLTRLGIGAFHIADLDRFEIANFNRQVGATLSTLGKPKVDVLADMARDINPQVNITCWPGGVQREDIGAFLDGVDLFIDGLDFFVLDIRAKVFARCRELGIPAITAAPIGFSAGFLVFTPDGMTFEDYFRLEGRTPEEQYLNFFLGLVPKALQRTYLVDPSRLDLAAQRGPSSTIGCQLCASVAGAEAIKILLGRGRVRAAPWYHQFDAYRGKFVVGKLRWGNRSPLQRLKAAAVSRRMTASPDKRGAPEPPRPLSQVEHILDLARWAPSGDNNQPWRFEVRDDRTVIVHVRDQSHDDVYDYAGGQPTLLSTGMLLETIAIAASGQGRRASWRHADTTGADHHRIEVQLEPATDVAASPLLPFIRLRTVDRRPYRRKPLTTVQKQALAASLGDELEVSWFESSQERRKMAALNGRATDIRLRIPEAFTVHRRIIDWERGRSPTGIPAGALGLDRMTLGFMRWAMKDWARMRKVNRMPGATIGARLQMDYLPGINCAAHFVLSPRAALPEGTERVPVLLRHGQAIQRFWLTATALGLAMQPWLAPLCFAHYGREGAVFTDDASIRAKAAALADALDGAVPGAGADVLFAGRLGSPTSAHVAPRSVRKPLDALLVRTETGVAVSASTPDASDATAPEQH